MKNQRFINQLALMAKDVAPVGAARICAGIVYKNEFVAYGLNQSKTHPFQAKHSPNPLAIYLHAEVDVIKNGLKRMSSLELSKATLYVVRMKYSDCSKGSMVQGLACPCKGCKKAIKKFGIKKVIYTIDGSGYEVMT